MPQWSSSSASLHAYHPVNTDSWHTSVCRLIVDHGTLQYVGVGTAAYYEVMRLSRAHVLQREERPVFRCSTLAHLRHRLASFHQRESLGSRVGDQLCSVEIIAVERSAARVAVSSWTGAQRLGKIQSNVNGIANLLNRALR